MIKASHLRRIGVLASIGFLAVQPAAADAYPDKPITIKVGYPAGGGADVAIRDATPMLQKAVGQSFVIVNLPGAASSIAAASVLQSPKDGYTLLATTGNDFFTAPYTTGAKYKPEDFVFVGSTGSSPLVLVSSLKHDFKSLPAFVAYLRTPGTRPLSHGTWGAGTAPHVASTDLQRRANVALLDVGYKGASPAMADVLGGQIDLAFLPLSGPVLGLIQTGKLRAIAVASEARVSYLPEVATFSETEGFRDFVYPLWAGLFVSKGTPMAIVEKWSNAMNAWQTSFENLSRPVAAISSRFPIMTVQQKIDYVHAESEKYRDIVLSLKLKPE